MIPQTRSGSLFPTVLPSHKYILIGLDYKFSSTIVTDHTLALGFAKKETELSTFKCDRWPLIALNKAMKRKKAT